MTTGVSTCHLSHLYLFLAHLSADNNLLVLDLTRSWDITSPSLRGLPQPSGPPAVSLGYLWNDYNNLYLYGGQFSDKPVADVPPLSIWRYSIKSQSWDEFKNPKTTAGNYSTDADIPLERAAEGAGISVPELGLSWYFGGHLDSHTTPGWSIHVPRLYLKSLLEFTHPGYVNDGLRIDGAGSEGAFRNITEGGLQVQDAFSERGDAALVFVPGWGERGILIGLAGGKVGGDLIDDLRTLDVFDIETSEWYHQETTGEAPRVRVNLCAVVASAPDASSFQIYVYGGQDLEVRLPFFCNPKRQTLTSCRKHKLSTTTCTSSPSPPSPGSKPPRSPPPPPRPKPAPATPATSATAKSLFWEATPAPPPHANPLASGSSTPPPSPGLPASTPSITPRTSPPRTPF